MLKIKFDVHIFSKSWAVIVSVGLCIAKRLKNRVWLDKHIFHSVMRDNSFIASRKLIFYCFLLPFDIVLRMSICHCSDVLHDDFWGFSFARSALAWNHDAGVFVLLAEHAICWIGHGVNVRRILEKFSSFVFGDELVAIDVHCPVGVDRNCHLPNVGVNFACLVSVKRQERIRMKPNFEKILIIKTWFPYFL